MLLSSDREKGYSAEAAPGLSLCAAIWDKMLSCGYHPTKAELLTLKRFGYFIDCKCSPTSVVGGGPAEDGVNAARWDVDVNRAFYNGWKSVHGLKHQTSCQVHCIYRK